MRRKLSRLLLIFCLIGVVVWFAGAGRFLVVSEPDTADAMLVLEGENDVRLQRGLELLRQGRAPILIIDAIADERVFGLTKPEIATAYIKKLPPVESNHIRICSILAQSTQQEARAAEPCLHAAGAHKVLLVTSDYHTRRARLIFRHELPKYEVHVVSARDFKVFGQNWWTNREWAKTIVSETARLVWFHLIDRWR